MVLAAICAVCFLAPPLDRRYGDFLINPPENLPLGGYTERHGRIMQPGGDNLHCRVTLLKCGTTRLALVSVEMLTIPESLRREVDRRLPPGWTLFLTATHTHCAPDSQMLNDRMTFAIPGIATFRPSKLTWYADHIAQDVVSTLKTSAMPVGPVSIAISHADANRPRRKFGLPDQTYSVVRGANVVLWAHYSAHATFYDADENQTREDWPGALSADLKAPTLIGAIGDVSPKAAGATPREKIANFVDTLLKARPVQVIDVWRPGDTFAVVRQPIVLGPPIPHPTFAKVYGVPPSIADVLVKKFAADSASITAFRIGKVAVVGVPGEPSSHLGRSIRDFGRTLGFASVLVVSHVNGWIGYLLGPEDYDRGGYEATLNFYGRDEGLKVVAAADQALDRLVRAR
jgi:hypothetical protein